MDIQNFSVTPRAAVSNTLPRFEIAAQVYDGAALVADFTGANTLMFPGVLASLSVEQRQTLIDSVAQTIVRMRAGVQ